MNKTLLTPTALDGLKVLDLTRVLAGPWASQTLADLGANVIKVERPGTGDDTRHWGPPYVDGSKDVSAYFSCANRNKRTLCIDLKTPEGREQVKSLAQHADVLLENFKVGDMAAWGLDYDSLSKANPGLIYCSISGFGQTGPDKHKPGYDLLIQAMCGLMSVTGESGREPQKAGVAVTDIFTGLYSVIGILAALTERQRSGLGQFLDLSLLDVGTAVMANQASNFLIGGKVPQPMGNAHPNIVPYQAFSTQSGHCVLAIGNDQQFERFCQVIGMPQLSADPRFTTNPQRVAHRDELIALLQPFLNQQPREHWQAQFDEAKIPFAPVNTMQQVFSHPQVVARNMCIEIEDESGRSVPGVASPLNLSRTPVQYHTAPGSLSSAERMDDEQGIPFSW